MAVPATLAIVGPDDEGLGAELISSPAPWALRTACTSRASSTDPTGVRPWPPRTCGCSPRIPRTLGTRSSKPCGGRAFVITPGVNLSTSIQGRSRASLFDGSDSVANEIQLILDDPVLAKRISAAGREFAASYDWDVVAP